MSLKDDRLGGYYLLLRLLVCWLLDCFGNKMARCGWLLSFKNQWANHEFGKRHREIGTSAGGAHGARFHTLGILFSKAKTSICIRFCVTLACYQNTRPHPAGCMSGFVCLQVWFDPSDEQSSKQLCLATYPGVGMYLSNYDIVPGTRRRSSSGDFLGTCLLLSGLSAGPTAVAHPNGDPCRKVHAVDDDVSKAVIRILMAA